MYIHYFQRPLLRVTIVLAISFPLLIFTTDLSAISLISLTSRNFSRNKVRQKNVFVGSILLRFDYFVFFLYWSWYSPALTFQPDFRTVRFRRRPTSLLTPHGPSNRTWSFKAGYGPSDPDQCRGGCSSADGVSRGRGAARRASVLVGERLVLRRHQRRGLGQRGRRRRRRRRRRGGRRRAC